MRLRRGAVLAGWVFVGTWVPLSVWRGIAFGRTFRIGHTDQASLGPLLEGIIQVAAVMLAPAAFAALVAFVLWAWRAERRQ